jgi:hypothetical protein
MIENGTRRSKWQQRAEAADVKEDAQAPEPEVSRTLGDRLRDLFVKGIELTDKAAVSSSADEICVPQNDWKY